MSSFGISFSIILVSEIGDKTFLIAAVLAMTNPPLLIYSAAMAALILMTLLSAAMGHFLPSLISKQLTDLLASLLFLLFGLKLVREATKMDGSELKEELESVTRELDEGTTRKNTEMEEMEAQSTPREQNNNNVAMHYLKMIFTPIWIQAFVMTMVAEWGDRSQIASKLNLN